MELLDSEVVEEGDPVMVADIEEEVHEVWVLRGTPAGRAHRVHHWEAEDVAVEPHGPSRVECRERGVVDAPGPLVEIGHQRLASAGAGNLGLVSSYDLSTHQ